MLNIILTLAFVYVLACVALYLLQNKLIFFPMAAQAELYQSVSHNQKTISINGEQLAGWRIQVKPTQSKSIIYFGGNAQDVVYLNFEANEFNIKQLITFNYPGYGNSSGKATQKSLYESALNVYDFALKEYQLKPEDIIVMGRSLGSSVATYLAAKREISRLILITPFDSVENIAAKHYPFFPVKRLMKHAFPTIDYIKQVKVPVLMLAAEQDEIIADENLENLKQAAAQNVSLIRYPGVGHNSIQTHGDYYQEINKFIDK